MDSIHPDYLLQVRWNAKDLLSIGPPFISLDFIKSRVISAVKLAELHVSHEIFMPLHLHRLIVHWRNLKARSVRLTSNPYGKASIICSNWIREV